MSSFSAEFVNAVDRGLLAVTRTAGPSDFGSQRLNATILNEIFAEFGRDPGYVYIPAGRYLIGRPLPTRTSGIDVPPLPIPELSEQGADLLVPKNITLKFAVGAVLVPAGYSNIDAALNPWLRRDHRDSHTGALDPPLTEGLKVYIEIQGRVEASVHPIFDVFMSDPTPTLSQEAGRVFFQTDRVRELYPEWWGAVPSRTDRGLPMTFAEIRRTTVAFQATIDAGFNHRVSLFRTDPSTPLPRNSIPVTLYNDYMIDRPLLVGLSIIQTQFLTGHSDNELRSNEAGFVMRGRRGSATRSTGASLIQAADSFAAAPDVPAMARSAVFLPVPEVDSVLVVRTSAGSSFENIVFDARGCAFRCVTISAERVYFLMGPGFEGCEFRNARTTLVHIGGEFSGEFTTATIMGVHPVIVTPNPAFSGAQHIFCAIFTQCRFQTLTDQFTKNKPPIFEHMESGTTRENWQIGVIGRADEAFLIEFHGCTFNGPANPMILLLGGRYSIQNCTFDTDTVFGSSEPMNSFQSWNGTDIFIAVPFAERLGDGRSQPLRMGDLTVCNVRSRSHQFLSTFEPMHQYSDPVSLGSVVLTNVRHGSRFPADSRLSPGDTGVRPAIYWGGPQDLYVSLILQGCVFDQPSGSTGAVLIDGRMDRTPIVDLGTRRVDGGPVLTATGSITLNNIMRLEVPGAR